MTQAPAPANDKLWERNATLLQLIVMSLTLASSFFAVVISYANRQAVIELRVTTLEDRSRLSDQRYQKRNEELAEINKLLTTLATQRENDHEALIEIRDELRQRERRGQ